MSAIGASGPTVSVIFATFNRPQDLHAAIQTVFRQSLLPAEIIVVDDSNSETTRDLVASTAAPVGVQLRYLRNHGPRGLTVARNAGVDASKGEVLCFLDDDVLLDPTYLATVVPVFENPRVMGAQGFWGDDNSPKGPRKFSNGIAAMFMNFHYSRQNCWIQSSGYPTYPYQAEGVMPCGWLSGCNQLYRRSVFQNLRFDENLLRAGFGEDVDFSSRVDKEFPGSLRLVGSARLVHNFSPEARTPSRKAVYLQSAYSQYLHSKRFGQRRGPRAAFVRARMGEFVIGSLRIAVPKGRPRRERASWLMYWISAQYLMFRHRADLREGDLEFVSGFL